MSDARHNNSDSRPVNLKGCPLCDALRACRLGACSEHAVLDDWQARGHESAWDAAAAYLVALGEALGAAMPDPMALVGCATIARLSSPRGVEPSRIEVAALSADRTRLDLQIFLTDWRRGGVG